MRLLLAFPALFWALTACSSPGSAARWETETLFDAGEKLGGCLVADLAPDLPGNEVAVVSESGTVYLLHRDGEGWSADRVGPMGGEMIQCAVGDVDPRHPGLELVCVGMLEGGEDDGGRGAAYAVRRDGEGWAWEPVAQDPLLLHAVAVGDFVTTVPGDEVLVAGYSKRAAGLVRLDSGWAAANAGSLPAEAKSAIFFEGGAAIGCTDGSLVWIEISENPRTDVVLDRAESAQSRLATDGERLLVCRNDGVLALIEGGARSEIYREDDRLRGAVLAELDPAAPGLEAATAGYSGIVTVLYREGEAWRAEPVHDDGDRLHHLAAGELDAAGAGLELVCCGYSGRVTLVRRVE